MALKFNPFTGNFDIVDPSIPVYDVLSVSVNTNCVVGKTYLVNTAAARTMTLPASHSSGDYVNIKDSTGGANSFNISVATADADTIDGAASDTIDSDYGSATYLSDGTNWFVL